MSYLNEVPVVIDGKEKKLYIADDPAVAQRLKDDGEAVMIYLHQGNGQQDFGSFPYAVEAPEELEAEYAERIYRRLKGLPWKILETDRCVIRETTAEDVDSFYRIYSHPDITRYMEGLYPEIEQEKQYVREYIEKVYAFYGFGVWTVVEKESGAVIGRAGLSYREGCDDPELGFIIGVPWQRKGYAYEVCRAILAYGWTALEFGRVQALVEPGNDSSLKLCEKLGFRQEGTVMLQNRECYRLLIQKNDLYAPKQADGS